MKPGQLVISLDFELNWGVHDTLSLDTYGPNIRGVQTVIPRLLDLFGRYHVKATWGIVGFLFHQDKEELLAHVPDRLPAYSNPKLSPYGAYLDRVGKGFPEDPHHFSPHLVQLILEQPQHEVGTHTYCHYYCLEPGQSAAEFEADLEMAIRVGAERGVTITSLIFPRNQYNKEYLRICAKHGILCIRGNERHWLYAADNAAGQTPARRGLRLLDSYVPLSGNHAFDLDRLPATLPIDIPASAFLRPYMPRLAFLDGLRLRRIKKSMTHAAKNGLVYHLWWHPHNFGIHQDENFAFLELILKHYQQLNRQYGFGSSTMSELARQVLAANNPAPSHVSS
ncbi:polysaccharide deacetylase family protein [Flaviaesturariibacter amylovorans]|uniref:Polysaccharide deacetylase family protein n=1 Tax=Flaviaesturariibacter amylovorans TaxID=1084520 RepID=A0ABP8GC33_9BACT